MSDFNVGDTIKLLTTFLDLQTGEICTILKIENGYISFANHNSTYTIKLQAEGTIFQKWGQVTGAPVLCDPNNQPVSTLVPALQPASQQTYNWTEICDSLWDKYTLD